MSPSIGRKSAWRPVETTNGCPGRRRSPRRDIGPAPTQNFRPSQELACGPLQRRFGGLRDGKLPGQLLPALRGSPPLGRLQQRAFAAGAPESADRHLPMTIAKWNAHFVTPT